ncbi:MAG: nucleotidyltransferase domain-containing protein [Bacteroidia bacterium]
MEATDTKLPEILAHKLSAIQEICRKYKVKYLWAFGSVLRDDFRKDSDIDFLYDLDEETINEGEYLYNLDGLIAGLLATFPDRKIDLVHYQSLRNPYFIKSVEATKRLLYDQRSKEVSV